MNTDRLSILSVSVILLAIFLSSCGENRPSPTSAPTSRPLASPTARPPSPTPSPTTTINPRSVPPTPSPSPSAIPESALEPAGPYAVGLDLAEAEAEVLSYLDPEREPRLELGRLISMRQIRLLRPDLPTFGEYALDDGNSLPDEDRPLYVIVVSTLGMRTRSRFPVRNEPSGKPWPDRSGFDSCRPVAPDQREAAMVLLDAINGERVGGESLGPIEGIQPLVDGLSQFAPAQVDPQRSATASTLRLEAFASATASSLAYASDADAWASPAPTPVPSLGLLEEMPQLVGRWWRYRYTSRSYGTYWGRAIITERIVAREPEPGQPAHLYRVRDVDWEVNPPQYPSRLGVFDEGFGSSDLAVGRMLRSQDPSLVLLEALGVYGSTPLVPGPDASGGTDWPGTFSLDNLRGRFALTEAIATRAGPFEPCLVHTEPINAGSVRTTFACKGPGIVWDEAMSCQTTGRSNQVIELVDWWGRGR